MCAPCARVAALCVRLAPAPQCCVCVCLAPRRRRRATACRRSTFLRATLAIWVELGQALRLTDLGFAVDLDTGGVSDTTVVRFFSLRQRYINFDLGFPRNHRCTICRLRYTYKIPFSHNYMFLHGFLYQEFIKVS